MIDKKLELEHWESEHTMEYHCKQFLEPKRMTVAFEEFLSRNCNISSGYILDLGCGGGQQMYTFLNCIRSLRYLASTLLKKRLSCSITLQMKIPSDV